MFKDSPGSLFLRKATPTLGQFIATRRSCELSGLYSLQYDHIQIYWYFQFILFKRSLQSFVQILTRLTLGSELFPDLDPTLPHPVT